MAKDMMGHAPAEGLSPGPVLIGIAKTAIVDMAQRLARPANQGKDRPETQA